MKVLLFSGGLDSFIYWRLLKDAQPVYVPMGHRYQEKELASIRRLIDAYPDLHVSMLPALPLGSWEQNNAYIPLRNLFLVCYASLNPAVTTVYLGALAGEAVRDKSSRFFRLTTTLLSFLHHRHVTVRAPFSNLTKAELIREYLKHYSPDGLYLTNSCYEPTVRLCGACNACFRRWLAMSANGLEEDYQSPPSEYDIGTLQDWLPHLRSISPGEFHKVLRNNYQAWRFLHGKRL